MAQVYLNVFNHSTGPGHTFLHITLKTAFPSWLQIIVSIFFFILPNFLLLHFFLHFLQILFDHQTFLLSTIWRTFRNISYIWEFAAWAEWRYKTNLSVLFNPRMCIHTYTTHTHTHNATPHHIIPSLIKKKKNWLSQFPVFRLNMP